MVTRSYDAACIGSSILTPSLFLQLTHWYVHLASFLSSFIFWRHSRPYLYSMPLLDKISQSSIDKALLLKHIEATEGGRSNIDGIHAAAASGDILDEERCGVELRSEDGRDRRFGW